MGYRAGAYGLEHIGLKSGPPMLICDCCGFEMEVLPGRGGGPPGWLRNRKAPRGWKRDIKSAKAMGADRPLYTCPMCNEAAHGQ